MLEVAEHYYHFDGRSPINDQNRELIAALSKAIAFATSAFGSYSGCRQYIEDIDRARAAVGDRAPVIDKIPPFSDHPGFIEAMTDRVRAALTELPHGRLVFTAHSVPAAMAQS